MNQRLIIGLVLGWLQLPTQSQAAWTKPEAPVAKVQTYEISFPATCPSFEIEQVGLSKVTSRDSVLMPHGWGQAALQITAPPLTPVTIDLLLAVMSAQGWGAILVSTQGVLPSSPLHHNLPWLTCTIIPMEELEDYIREHYSMSRSGKPKQALMPPHSP